jgi:hypothetical protein
MIDWSLANWDWDSFDFNWFYESMQEIQITPIPGYLTPLGLAMDRVNMWMDENVTRYSPHDFREIKAKLTRIIMELENDGS